MLGAIQGPQNRAERQGRNIGRSKTMAQAAKPQTQTPTQTTAPTTPVLAQPSPRPGSVFTDFASI